MKRIYEKPEMQVTEFESDSITNVTALSSVQNSYFRKSATEIESINSIDL